MTPLFGQLPFFIDFLKTSGPFDALVADCPLRYTSPECAKKARRPAMIEKIVGSSRRQA
jgi:hypothetical protein